MNKQEIIDICRKYNIEDYSINPDGSIDVEGDVYLYNMGLTKLPLKFNKVSGCFDCSSNKLTSLEGSPNDMGGDFDCYMNELKNLIGIGIVNGENIFCEDNPLETFEGYNGDFNKLRCYNKEKLIRKTKLKLIDQL